MSDNTNDTSIIRDALKRNRHIKEVDEKFDQYRQELLHLQEQALNLQNQLQNNTHAQIKLSYKLQQLADAAIQSSNAQKVRVVDNSVQTPQSIEYRIQRHMLQQSSSGRASSKINNYAALPNVQHQENLETQDVIGSLYGWAAGKP